MTENRCEENEDGDKERGRREEEKKYKTNKEMAEEKES